MSCTFLTAPGLVIAYIANTFFMDRRPIRKAGGCPVGSEHQSASAVAAEDAVSYTHLFTVNGKKVNIPSYLVKAGDVIEVAESSRSSEVFKRLVGQDAPSFLLPPWLEREKNTLKGTVTRLPVREEIDTPIEEHLIVELYSK